MIGLFTMILETLLRFVRKRTDYDFVSFDRRKGMGSSGLDRYASSREGYSGVIGGNGGGISANNRVLHRSVSFSGSRREFAKGFRLERDWSRREWSVSSWRRRTTSFYLNIFSGEATTEFPAATQMTKVRVTFAPADSQSKHWLQHHQQGLPLPAPLKFGRNLQNKWREQPRRLCHHLNRRVVPKCIDIHCLAGLVKCSGDQFVKEGGWLLNTQSSLTLQLLA
ncbi:hypothetical protein LINGRAHAP2_LOCUS8611 [Linum grandiflorum]